MIPRTASLIAKLDYPLFPGPEELFSACSTCCIFPLAILLLVVAIRRNQAWAAWTALLLVLTFGWTLFILVRDYLLSSDGDIQATQELGRQLLRRYFQFFGIVAIGFVVYILRWYFTKLPAEQPPATLPPDEPINP